MILAGAEPFLLKGGSHGVLLVHGFTGLPAELLMMGKYLQERGFTVLGVRLAGHGTTPEDMSRTTKHDWIDSVRDGYAILSGLTERISVAGHSMGGLLSLLLAAEKPIDRLALLAAPMFICEERGIKYLPSRETCRGKYFPKARRKLPNVPKAVNKTYRKMPLSSVHELVEIIELAKGSLSSVKCPVFIAHSHGDHTASPDSVGYLYEHLASEEKEVLWLEDSGHLLPLDVDREKVFESVADFFERE